MMMEYMYGIQLPARDKRMFFFFCCSIKTFPYIKIKASFRFSSAEANLALVAEKLALIVTKTTIFLDQKDSKKDEYL
jgi:hypothetical protein